MDKQAQMLAIAQRLQHAGRRRDWQELARVDAELAAQARRWRDEGAVLSADEQRALQRLSQTHGDVSAQCRAELQQLEQTLAQVGAEQGRWQAYAQSSNWEDSR
jgi:hypothetical protein